MSHCPLDIEKLNEHLYVDISSPTGLRWKKRHWKMAADSIAGCFKDTGHCTVNFFGKRYHVHRIVWALKHQTDPGDLTVDHIDRNPANNDPSNLRLSSASGQLYNTKDRPSAYGRNVKRVGDRFYARINVNGKTYSIGGHATPEEAAQAAKQGAPAH